ncbi:MAG: hypothetical protein AAB227_02050 [Pseudomonadota bacterium]
MLGVPSSSLGHFENFAMLTLPIIAALLVAAASPPVNAALAEPAEASAGAAPLAHGWIKSFAIEPIAASPGEARAPFEAPDYLGTLIEGAARAAMRGALLEQGYKEAGPDSEGLITFSVSVSEPKPKGPKGLPKSPIRLEGVDDDPTDNIRHPEVRPYIALSGEKAPTSAPPAIEVTIYARRDRRRIWSGYAGAPADAGDSREEIAVALAQALLAHFGETVDLPEAEIPLGAAPQ